MRVTLPMMWAGFSALPLPGTSGEAPKEWQGLVQIVAGIGPPPTEGENLYGSTYVNPAGDG